MIRAAALAREVLAQRIAIVAAVTALLHLAVVFHVVTPDWSTSVTNAVTGALDALGVIAGVLFARTAVTPVKDPRDSSGVPLRPVVESQPGVEPDQTPYMPEHAAD